MPKKVLIIDDNEDCLEMLQEVLTYEGFEVIAISGTNNIFELLENYQPDILLIDYILSGINGGEICSQVKHNERTCKLPVIIISAYSKVIGSLGYYDCNAFIAKPFELRQLTEKIAELSQHTLS